MLNLEILGLEGYTDLELHIYSNTGKLVYSSKIHGQQQLVINSTAFAQGVYYCKILSGQTELYQTEFVKIK
jgi:hypothetical protein